MQISEKKRDTHTRHSMEDDKEWVDVYEFRPNGVLVYRNSYILVSLEGEGDRLHYEVVFDEFSNFLPNTLNVRVTGGPLKLSSFHAVRKESFPDLVYREGSGKALEGRVMSSQPLQNGRLLVKLQDSTGGEIQITDAVQIETPAKNTATVYLEFERNPKLGSTGVARVPVQINYVLDQISARVTYQLNLDHRKLEGFVRINNSSNRQFDGDTSFSTALLRYNLNIERPKVMRYEMTRAAPPSQDAAAAAGLDNFTIELGRHSISERSSIAFVNAAVDVAVLFEITIGLPAEMRDTNAQPILEMPVHVQDQKLADGLLELYHSTGRLLTHGHLTAGATKARVALQPLDNSVSVSSKVEFSLLNKNQLVATVSLSMHHTGTKTATLRLRFPDTMRRGQLFYVAASRSNLTFETKLQPSLNQDTVTITYLRQERR